MIKIVNASYHANIGDCLSSRYLKGIVETLSGKESQLIGYNLDYSTFDGNDIIVIGTGGMLGQLTKFPLLELDKISNIPIIIFGAGFNREYNQPYSLEWEEYTRKLMGRVKLGGLRNSEDAKLARVFGLENSYWCPDPLLFLNNPINNKQTKTIGLCLCEYTAHLKLFIEDSIKRVFPEYTIIEIKHQGFNKPFRFGIYDNCDYVVTTRYHSALISASFEKPVFFINHNIKQDNLYADIYPDVEINNYCHVENVDNLPSRLQIFRECQLSVDCIIDYKLNALMAYNKFCRIFEELI